MKQGADFVLGSVIGATAGCMTLQDVSWGARRFVGGDGPLSLQPYRDKGRGVCWIHDSG